MIPQYSSPLAWALDTYIRFKLQMNFNQIFIECEKTNSRETQKSTLFVSNHVSWWDGFLISQLRRRMGLHSPHYTIMLESELEKFPLFRRVGVIGINPSSVRSIKRTFSLVKKLFESSTPVSLAYFPQGKIVPQLIRPLQFRSGIETLLRHCPAIRVVPVALHMEPLNSPKPAVFVRAGQPLLSDAHPITASLLQEKVETLVNLVANEESLRCLMNR